MFHIAARCARPSHKLPTTPVCNAAHTPPQYGSDMNITFDGWDIYAGPWRLQREIALPLKRGSLHCIVPNYEIEKFNKWSVVKFIFHRLVRYNEDDFICENPWQNKQRFGSIIFVSRLPAVRDLPASVIVTKYVTQFNLYIKDGHGW